MKTALSIAGSDCSGGAGIQADLKTMTMNGVYAMSAIAALTAQNTTGVTDISEVSPEFLKEQIDAVFTDIRPDAVKTGMIPTAALIRVTAERLKFYDAQNIIVDPVMVATSGSRLMESPAVAVMKKELLPISTLVTPNIPEAAVLSGMEIKDKDDMEKAAAKIHSECGCAVLLKGGHSIEDASDLLYNENESFWFYGKRIANPNTHGTGCTLSSAIAANLAKGYDLKASVKLAKDYISAVNMGAEAIMDLSSHGNTQPFRQKLTHECPAMIGTVPVYDSVIHYQRDLDTLTAKDFIDVIRLHAEDGVDFVTLHCGITRKTIDQIRKHKRKMNIVSRGGSLVFAWMCMTGEENPFYEYYDEILDICREYDVTISLGDACRPGCLADATDVCQIEELVRLGELTKRAWEKDVQVMVEGPGHVPMDQIAANMKVQQTICMGAPFYVLGPLVTDIAPGYDHITAAIGGAMAAMSGAAFLCYVTPAEHLALPNLDDVKQGIIASRIAAHAADIAKGVRGARDIDDKMGDARRALDWEAQWKCAIDPETAKAIRDDRSPEHDDTCSMCGKFCAVRSMNKALAGEHIDIL
jgi:phosphomethylpyrimidine synthase